METIKSVTDIHNKRVYDAQGNDCGHVSSLLFDSNDSQLLFAIITLEDDVESKGSTAIPWNSLNLNPNTGDITLRINRELLIGAPKITDADFKPSNPNGYGELLKYYGYSSTKQNEDSPITHDVLENYHQKHEGEEYTGSPLDDRHRNNMGEEMDFDKIKGNKE